MSKKQTIGVELRAAAELVPYERNARKHPADQVRQIANLIREFGWTNPILADEGGIVAGHGRQLAANLIYAEGGQIFMAPGEANGGQELPPGMVPVVDCSGWDERQRRAYILADNASALASEWDDDLLKLELSFLDGAGFDLGLTGFDGDALAAALGGGSSASNDPDPLKVSLADRFGIPPFSVMSARDGWWQDRKRAWLALGIMSELGRGEGSHDATPGGAPMPLDRKKNARTFGQDMLDGEGITPRTGPRRSTEAGRKAKASATPGGSPMPATSYSKTKARGDGRGRVIKAE